MKKKMTSRGSKKDKTSLIIIVLSVLGLAISAYLTFLYLNNKNVAFCVTGSDCDVVRESIYAKFLGIPVSVVGIVGYSGIILFSLISLTKKSKWLLLYILSLGGFAFSVYLTYLELFVIKAICSFCVISAILITAIFILLVIKKNVLSPKTSYINIVLIGVFVAGLVIFGSVYIQAKNEAVSDNNVDPFKVGLAKHLTKVRATMYGSYRCPHCTTQEKYFGDAFKYVRYVECHPRGPNAKASLCLAKGIRNYPTWIIGGRYYPGTISLQDLAQISGYKQNE